MSGPSDNGLAAIFGWPVVVAGLSLAGLLVALFWEGPVDLFASLLLAAPVVAALLARARRAR